MHMLCSKKSFPSGRLLRDTLQEILGKKIKITTKNFNLPPIVRYGNPEFYYRDDTIYNSSDFIRLCSDKRRFSNTLIENEITDVPVFRRDSQLIFPLIVRTSLFLSGGLGIIVCRNLEEFENIWQPRFWWTPFIKTDFELRVHVLGGKISKIFRKVYNNEGAEEFPIRNNHNSHFVKKNIEKYSKLEEIVGHITNIFGENNFFALDIGWDSRNKRYFIFEANSAPGLNFLTAKDYASFLAERIQG